MRAGASSSTADRFGPPFRRRGPLGFAHCRGKTGSASRAARFQLLPSEVLARNVAVRLRRAW
eukprot:3416083-Pyramimonas_sp.AAC.1